MSDRNLLFFEESLDAQLRRRQEAVHKAVDRIPKDQFLISKDQEFVDHVVAKLKVEPLVLHENAATMSQNETRVDVSGDFRRVFMPGHSGPFHIPGTCVDIDIPFTGEEWIFRYRTNTWSSVFPQAEVRPGHLRLSISRPHDVDSAEFKSIYERELSLIRKYVGYSHNQVVTYNENLTNLVQQSVNLRRDRIGRHDNIAALLDIPLATQLGAPSIEPVKVEIRPPPALPKVPKSGLAPEPGITDETYEHILKFIRHQGRTFEQTPRTFAVHGEEDLRNIILAQLNGHFLGDAAGEAFRGNGKTDICIEQENRAAFVGECKLWTGAAGLTAAMDQLLGYLTWRDSKAALIMFNVKNKNFTNILRVLPTALHAHPLFLRELACSEAGEWRVQMRSAENEGRRVTVQAFVFNLFRDGG